MNIIFCVELNLIVEAHTYTVTPESLESPELLSSVERNGYSIESETMDDSLPSNSTNVQQGLSRIKSSATNDDGKLILLRYKLCFEVISFTVSDTLTTIIENKDEEVHTNKRKCNEKTERKNKKVRSNYTYRSTVSKELNAKTDWLDKKW
jgi:hypothetical protein